MKNNNFDNDLVKFYDYLDSGDGYRISSEKDFMDKALEYLGEKLTKMCKDILESLKKKFMIGKYSRNIRKMRKMFTEMGPCYNDIIQLDKHIDEYIYSLKVVDELTKVSLKFKKELNKKCEKISKMFFIDNSNELNFMNPDEACYNYQFIKSYINKFKYRN